MEENTRVICNNIGKHPLGRVTMAGFIRHSRGTGWDTMRILGSYALVYLYAGNGIYQNAENGSKTLTAGDLIVIYPDVPHRYGPRPHTQEYWNEFYVVFDGPVFDLWRSQGLLHQTIVHRQPVAYWLSRLVGAVENRMPLEAVIAVQDFLSQIIQKTPATTQDADWLIHAKSILEGFKRVDQVDIPLAAGVMGETYETFRKKFQRLSGISPGRFAAQTLIARACTMLLSEKLNSADIAAACGFCDEFHFARRFKHFVGLTPTKYRHQLINQR